eukprot:COSAG01_NODE_17247_length_1166_cov_56.400187_2_plen_133_part_00
MRVCVCACVCVWCVCGVWSGGAGRSQVALSTPAAPAAWPAILSFALLLLLLLLLLFLRLCRRRRSALLRTGKMVLILSAVAIVNSPVFAVGVVSPQLSDGLVAGIELVVLVLDDANVESGTNSSSCPPKVSS